MRRCDPQVLISSSGWWFSLSLSLSLSRNIYPSSDHRLPSPTLPAATSSNPLKEQMEFIHSLQSDCTGSSLYPSTVPLISASTSSTLSSIHDDDDSGASSAGLTNEERRRARSALSKFAGSLAYGLLTCVFAIVGSLIGAITGAILGLASESGFLCGAGIGAISGAVFSMDVVESCLNIWRFRGSGIWSIVFLIDVIAGLFSGRVVRDEVGPAVQSAVQSQMSAMETPFREATDIFETGGTKGMATAAVQKICKKRLTTENILDSSGEKLGCSVCLQDLQLGETVRSLPHCGHMFHLPCIDGWLTRHGSCPLCRRDL